MELKYYYYKPNIFTFENLNSPIALLNIAYVIYFVMNYNKYLLKEKLVTSTENTHLKWPWIKYFNPLFYLILFAVNIFYLTNFNYSLGMFIITYFFLYLSYKWFPYNIGELWCFFGSFIPAVALAFSYLI